MERTRWLAGSIVLVLLLVTAKADDFLDLQGPYCAQKNTCCDGRQDNCAVPILGTLCYCDDFCNSTGILHNDCCPDYWSFCRGMVTPVPFSTTTVRPPYPDDPLPLTRCSHNGIYHDLDIPFWENCNKCRCVKDGLSARIDCEDNICLVTDRIINGVNNLGLSWRASNYSEFWGRTLKDGIKLRLGTLPPAENVKRMQPVIKIYNPALLPREFDSESKWPRYIHGIEDQGWCGSSWALSTASVASDRYAIISKGLENVKLSIQNILSCSRRRNKLSDTCTPGHLDRAWLFLRKYGVVDEDCFPYRPESTYVQCKVKRKDLLTSAGCSPPLNQDRKHQYRVGPAYKLRNETDIMDEIIESGPVQATLKVYHDFFSYGGGIYSPSRIGEHNTYGYHSVKIVGWGEENYKKYWKVANSWGRQWGENGYFRITRGNNECDIETFVLGVWPEIENDIAFKNP